MASYKVGLGLRKRTSYRDGLVMGVVEELETSNIMEESENIALMSDDGEMIGDTALGSDNNKCSDISSSVRRIHSAQRSFMSQMSDINNSSTAVSACDNVNISDNNTSYGNTLNETPRKSSAKVQIPHPKLKKFRKYDTFIWLREPSKNSDWSHPGKPLNRLRSLSSL